jgi:U3 small nucleolar ribonucleoprotein protein IMP4
VKELADACRANDVTDLIVLHEHRGIPGNSHHPHLFWGLMAYIDAMIISHFPHGPTVFFTLYNVVLRHDIESYKSSTVSEQYPHLIFENFSSKLGERIRDVLKYLFPVPKEDSKRIMTFANEDDFISFRWEIDATWLFRIYWLTLTSDITCSSKSPTPSNSRRSDRALK